VPSKIWALPITFEANHLAGGNWIDSGAYQSGGPLETSAAALDTLAFTYTFNSNTPDSDLSPDWGVYGDAIKDCNLSIGAYSFSCDNSQSNDIELGFISGYTVNGVEFGVEEYHATATLSDALGFSNISFEFFTEWTSVPKGTFLPGVDALITEPWSALSADTFFDIYYTYGGQMYSARSATGPATWTSVPIPPVLWLLGTGLGLIGIARRKTA
jgi:hypothetical protein